jgi:HD domain
MTQTAMKPAVRAYIASVILLATGAFGATALLDGRFPADWGSHAAGIFTFLVVGILLELAEHRLAVSASGSISFIVYIAACLVFGPAWGALLTAVSLAAAHTVNRRPPLKIAFNAAQQTLAIVVGGQLYMAVGGRIPPVSLDQAIGPFIGLVIGFFAVNSLAVSFAVALSEGRPLGEVWLRNTWSLAPYDLVASTLGLGIAILYASKYGLFAVGAVVALILFLRHVYVVNLQLQAANREMLDVMVKSIEARDPYTSGHSQRVSETARMLARELGLSLREIDSIAMAALLHDVGKIYEDFAPLLRKGVSLSDNEFLVMQTHPIRSAELVGTVSNLRGPVEKAVRHHHENYDGSGYPDKLAGDSIPIGARIIMVADTVDAMTSHRPYRRALGYAEVTSELQKYSGIQFDPQVVRAFLRSAPVRALIESRLRAQAAVVEEEPQKTAAPAHRALKLRTVELEA